MTPKMLLARSLVLLLLQPMLGIVVPLMAHSNAAKNPYDVIYQIGTNGQEQECKKRCRERIPSRLAPCCRYELLCICYSQNCADGSAGRAQCLADHHEGKHVCLGFFNGHTWNEECPKCPKNLTIMPQDDPEVVALREEVVGEARASLLRTLLIVAFVLAALIILLCLAWACWTGHGRKGDSTDSSSSCRKAVRCKSKPRKASGEDAAPRARPRKPSARRASTTGTRVNMSGPPAEDEPNQCKSRRTRKANDSASLRAGKTRRTATRSRTVATTTGAASDTATSASGTDRTQGSSNSSKRANSFNSRAVATQVGFSQTPANMSALSKKVNMEKLRKLAF